MANELAIQFLTQQITGLGVIRQELSRMFTITGDLNLKDEIRAELTSLNEMLFALQSARNSLVAASNVIPPPDRGRVKALTNALRQLDTFVRNDQNIRTAISFLTQVAGLINEA